MENYPPEHPVITESAGRMVFFKPDLNAENEDMAQRRSVDEFQILRPTKENEQRPKVFKLSF